MSFKALIGNVTKKFENVSAQLPDIGADIRAGFEKTLNDFKAESGLADLEKNLGRIAGLSVGDLTQNFANIDPAIFKTNLPAKPGPISFTTAPGTLVPGQSAPPWPNELEPYASHNVILTLACLTPKEINDPANTFRKNGFTYVICRSGGTGGSREKIKTAVEIGLGANVEFYIDDFELNSVITPTMRSRITNVNTFSFTALEPYSMGMFWQALQVAALEAGYSDYTLASFALQIDFKGWNVDGVEENIPYTRKMIPFRFTKGEMSVNEGGASYNMECVAWNEAALTDTVQQIKTDIALKGRTVREVLQTGGESLTEILNKRLKEMEEADQIVRADQYVIIFPTDTSSDTGGYDEFGVTSENTSSATQSPIPGEVDPSGPRYTGQGMERLYQSIVGTQATEVPATFSDYYAGLANNTANAKQIEFMFKKYAGSDYSKNNIGRASIIGDPVEAGIQPMNPPSFRASASPDEIADRTQRVEQANAQAQAEFRSQYEIFNRTDSALQISDDSRVFKFKAGTRIQEIIEEVVITSMYGRSLLEQLKDIKHPQGLITWYKVETDTYIIPDEEELQRSGSYPQLYVYRVIPYQVPHTIFSKPGEPAVGVSELKRDVAKQYNYIYTGKNKDVLDYKIEYNYSFIAPITADRGSNPANTAQGPTNQQNAGAPDEQLTTSSGNTGSYDEAGVVTPGRQAEVVDNSTGSQSAGLDNSAIQVARMFNDRLMHSQHEMINVEMEIMGDPFWIADSGIGNYHAKETSYSAMTADGSLNSRDGFVYLNLLFRTPVDIGQPDGTYVFPEELIIVDQYSGLFFCTEITHKIYENQFTQTLKLTRIPNQTESDSRANVGALVPVSNPTQAINSRAVDFQNKVSEAASTLGIEANYSDYLREVQNILPGFQSLNSVIQAQKENLNGPALEAFGRIGDALTGAQSALDAGNLAKIGGDFTAMIGAAGTLIDATSSIDAKLEGTLNQLGLDGQNVLGAIGSEASNAVNQLSRVQVEIPNAIESAASDAASALRALNARLK